MGREDDHERKSGKDVIGEIRGLLEKTKYPIVDTEILSSMA
jgi:hypothetical protein